MHSDSECLEIGTYVLDHFLIRSLVRLLAHSLAPELVGQWNIFVQFSKCPESLCRVQSFFISKSLQTIQTLYGVRRWSDCGRWVDAFKTGCDGDLLGKRVSGGVTLFGVG